MPGNIQSFEVVVIVFDFRPLLYAITGTGKDFLNALQGAGYRMQTTQVLPPSRQCYVNGFRRKPGFNGRFLKICPPCVDGLLHLPLGFIDLLAGRRALLRRELAQSFCLLGNHTLFAEVFHTNLIKRLQVVGLFYGIQPVLNQLLQVFH